MCIMSRQVDVLVPSRSGFRCDLLHLYSRVTVHLCRILIRTRVPPATSRSRIRLLRHRVGSGAGPCWPAVGIRASLLAIQVRF